jgi:two-component system, response regulator, stage 0 sporulation protein F
MARRQQEWKKGVVTELVDRRPRLLLAEDDDDLRAIMCVMLARDGYEIIEAANGGELLDRLGTVHLEQGEASPIDLIVSDIQMPGFTGLQVLQGIRSSDWATPVILITAFGTEELRREARRLGALAFFDKPFDVDDLRTIVLNAMPPPSRSPSWRSLMV